jgi:hypothetical protein
MVLYISEKKTKQEASDPEATPKKSGKQRSRAFEEMESTAHGFKPRVSSLRPALELCINNKHIVP